MPPHSTDVVIDEGKAFLERHPDIAGNPTVADLGGLMWGLLRALMECPDCAGHYRVPLDKEWDKPGGRLYCTSCQGVWVKQDDPPPTKKRSRQPRAERDRRQA